MMPSATTSPGRRRCSASSRATSARARPRSPPMRSRRRPGRVSRVRSSPRPTCWPASTSRRSARCSTGVGIGVTLLTGSLKADVKARALEAIASGQALVIVGTHALIQDAVTFADLGLVVIDEQHRFGVDQRGALEAKAGGRSPHVLLMTATPIPRTLGQVLYADLDVSDLRTPPAGRVQIRTGIQPPGRPRRDLAEGPRGSGRSAIGRSSSCPLIEEGADEGDGAVAAESEAVRLAALLDPLRVGMVHGRLKPAERDAEMTRFRDGELDVLVGTTVVEVGVDVPAATMMVIEGADRFGLAQLHQLRGRVGRGTRRVVLRPRVRVDRRDRPGAPEGGRRDRTTASPWPRRTSSCARRAMSSGLPRAASRACASPRSRSPRIATWRSGLAPMPRRCSTTPGGWTPPRPGARGGARDRLAPPRRGRGTGERSVTGRGPWLTRAGSSPGSARGIRLEAPGAGDAAVSRSGQADPVRHPGAGPCGRAGPRPLRGVRGGRARGAVARGRPRDVRRDRTRVPRRSSPRTSRGPTSPAPAGAVVRAEALAWLARPGGRGGRAVRRRRRRPAIRGDRAARRCLERLGAATASRPARGSWPSTSGATPRRRRSGC